MMFFSCMDSELLYMIHQQDEWALQYLIRKYQPMIRGMIRSHYELQDCGVSPSAFCEDLQQESCVTIVKAAERYREDCACSFKTFLTQCLRKHYIAVYRHSKSARDAAFYQCESLDLLINEDHAGYKIDYVPSQDRFTDPAYLFKLSQSAEIMKEMKRFLTNEEWTVLTLILQSTPYVQGAKLLGCSRKTYDNKVFRVRCRVKELIRRFEAEN